MDNNNKKHDKESLAKVLKGVWDRLNSDSHTIVDAGEFQAAGRKVVVRVNGLSGSEANILECLFNEHSFPVEVVPLAAPLPPPRPAR